MSEAPDGGQPAPEDTSLAESEALIHGKPAEAEEETDQLADDAGAETTPPKKRQSAQERIDELTAARREAEREAEFWRSKATQAPQQPPATTTPPPQEGRPDPNAYATDDEYLEALADWKVDQRMAKIETATRQQTAAQTFNQRVASQFPDGEPAGLAAFRRLTTVPVAVNEIMVASENSPKLAEYLGNNPAEIDQLANLSPAMQAYKLAQIEARISAPSTRKPADTPAATPQVRGAGGQFKPGPDTNDFDAFRKAHPLG